MPSLSPRAELAIVTLAAFAVPIATSLFSLVVPSPEPPITERGLWSLAAYEIPLLLVLGLFLRLRGWDSEQLGLRRHRRDTVFGIAIALSSYAAVMAIHALASASIGARHLNSPHLVQAGITLPTALLVSAVNAIFEEVFVCGYPIAVLKPSKGAAFAVNVSAAIRLSYHLYQGTASVLSVIPIGLIFGWWVARTGRLWPVIVAHALIDVVGLALVHR